MTPWSSSHAHRSVSQRVLVTWHVASPRSEVVRTCMFLRLSEEVRQSRKKKWSKIIKKFSLGGWEGLKNVYIWICTMKLGWFLFHLGKRESEFILCEWIAIRLRTELECCEAGPVCHEMAYYPWQNIGLWVYSHTQLSHLQCVAGRVGKISDLLYTGSLNQGSENRITTKKQPKTNACGQTSDTDRHEIILGKGMVTVNWTCRSRFK